MMNGLMKAALLAVTLALGGCGAGGGAGGNGTGGNGAGETPPVDRSTSIAGLKIGGPFTLTDQDGKPQRWDDFAGSYRIVYFGYTYCPDVCPVDLQRIMQGYDAFAKADPARARRVQPIFITIDPARDTPAALKSWIDAFQPHNGGKPLIGLTGTQAQIDAVAHDFAVAFSRESGTSPKDYLVAHTRTPYLFGPDGKPIALVPVDDPSTPAEEGLPRDILAFLKNRIG